MHDLKSYKQTPDAPDALRLHPDGTLTCVDGTAPAARLRELYARLAQPGQNGMPVCIMHRDHYSMLASDAYLGAHMSA